MILISFIGGPSAGKTSTMDALKAHLRADACDIYWIPEIFGALYLSMPSAMLPSMLDPGLVPQRQYVVARTEILLAEQYDACLPKDAVVFTDRGVFDIEGYCTPEDSRLLYEALGDFRQPDLCIAFETARDDRNLRSDTRTLRVESDLTESQRIAERTFASWQQHVPPERFRSFPQYPTVEDKARAVAEAIHARIGREIFSF